MAELGQVVNQPTNPVTRSFSWLGSDDGRWLRVPTIAFAVTRLLVVISTLLAMVSLNMNNKYVGFWPMWNAWDAEHYVGIVEKGYTYSPDATTWSQNRVAFFPLYPLTIGAVRPLTNNNTIAAGMGVSNLCFFLALIVMYRLAEFELGDLGTARRAIYYLAAFPSSFFFSAVYTESLFLLFAVLTIYLIRRHYWGWAGITGLFTSAIRSPGLILVLFAGLEWLSVHDWRWTEIHKGENWKRLFQAIRTDFGALVAIAIMPLGLVAYMVYLQIQFGDPFVFVRAQVLWHRDQIGPIGVSIDLLKALKLHAVYILSGKDVDYNLYLLFIRSFDYGLFLCVLALCVTLWRRLNKTYAIYTVVAILLPLWSSYESISRYAMIIFPVFFALALITKNVRLSRVVLVVFSILLMYLTFQYHTGHWVA